MLKALISQYVKYQKEKTKCDFIYKYKKTLDGAYFHKIQLQYKHFPDVYLWNLSPCLQRFCKILPTGP